MPLTTLLALLFVTAAIPLAFALVLLGEWASRRFTL
jgi:hypothetical protein